MYLARFTARRARNVICPRATLTVPLPPLLALRSNVYAKVITDQEHAETLEAARTEQRALEAAIAKSQKKLREAAAVGVAGV